MEMFLNIISQHFICTEIRRIINHIQTLGAAFKKICNIKNCYCYCNYCESIIVVIQSLEESGLSIKGISERIKNESKEQKGGFLMLLGASLLGNLLAGIFELQKYYQNKPKFNCVYSRNNLRKIKYGSI